MEITANDIYSFVSVFNRLQTQIAGLNWDVQSTFQWVYENYPPELNSIFERSKFSHTNITPKCSMITCRKCRLLMSEKRLSWWTYQYFTQDMVWIYNIIIYNLYSIFTDKFVQAINPMTHRVWAMEVGNLPIKWRCIDTCKICPDGMFNFIFNPYKINFLFIFWCEYVWIVFLTCSQTSSHFSSSRGHWCSQIQS